MPNSSPAARISSQMRGASLGRDVDFETVFARVAGARDARRNARNLAVHEPVVADGGEIGVAVSFCSVAQRFGP